MERSFTLNDLNRYTNELDRYFTDRVVNARPSKKVIRNLLGYSSALTVLKTSLTGQVNMILN